MQLKLSTLKTDRQWRSTTGFSKDNFHNLLQCFELSYRAIFQQTVEERTSQSPNTPNLTGADELLLFTLFSLKSALTYDLLGFVSGMDGSNAKRNQSLGVQVLQRTLLDLGLLPQREFKDVAEFETYFEKHKKILIDATEQRIQRPRLSDAQKAHYSGKKKDIL